MQLHAVPATIRGHDGAHAIPDCFYVRRDEQLTKGEFMHSVLLRSIAPVVSRRLRNGWHRPAVPNTSDGPALKTLKRGDPQLAHQLGIVAFPFMSSAPARTSRNNQAGGKHSMNVRGHQLSRRPTRGCST